MKLNTLVSPSPTLFLLSRLQIWGAFRSLSKRVFTLPGLYVFLIVLTAILPFFFDKHAIIHSFGKVALVFGPLTLGFLFFYAFRVGLTGCAFYFSPAETNFLLAGPVSKDQLLAYKVQQYLFGALITDLILSMHLSHNLAEFAFLFVEVYLVFLFLILLPLVVGSFFGKDEKLVEALRLLVDVVLTTLLFSVVGAIFFRMAGRVSLSDKAGFFFRMLVLPFDYFYRFFGSADSTKLLVGNGILLLTNMCLLLVFLKRSDKLEIESIFYKNLLQHRRSSGRLRGQMLRPAEISLSFRAFPHWGGIGPLLWCKAHEVIRGYHNLVFLFSLLSLGFVSVLLFYMNSRASFDAGDPYLSWHILFNTEIFALIALLFSGFADFRSDGDKIESLMALPIRAWKTCVGYLLLPVILLSGFCVFLLLLGFGILHHYFPSYPLVPGFVACVAVIPFLSVVMICADNLCFLLFPVQNEVKGRLIGNFLSQSSAQFVMNLSIACALARAQDRAMMIASRYDIPFLGFSISMILLLGSVGVALFLLLSTRLKHFNVTRLAS